MKEYRHGLYEGIKLALIIIKSIDNWNDAKKIIVSTLEAHLELIESLPEK